MTRSTTWMTVGAVALLGFCLAPATADAATPAKKCDWKTAKPEFVVDVGTIVPSDTPWSTLLEKMKRRVHAETACRVRFKIHYGGKKGSEKDLVRECQLGNIELVGVSTAALASKAREVELVELPYLFPSVADADRIIDTVLHEDVKKVLAKKGFVPWIWAENGYRSFYSRKGFIKTPADMKGLRMRSQESLVHTDTYTAFGASPVAVAATEVLTVLSSGGVDGFDNTPLFAYASSWFSQVDYLSLSEHIYQPGLLVYSKKFLDRVPDDLKSVLLGYAEELQKEGRVKVRKLNKVLIGELRDRAGIKIHEMTAAEKAAFKKLSDPVHKKFLKRTGATAMKMYGKIKKAL